MRNWKLPVVTGVTALLLAACSGGPAAATPLASLGAGEGELNLVIWSGYAEDGSTFPEYDWVTPFEEATGCEVKTAVQADSANGVQLAAFRRIRRRGLLGQRHRPPDGRAATSRRSTPPCSRTTPTCSRA